MFRPETFGSAGSATLLALVVEAERALAFLASAGTTRSGFTAIRSRDMDPVVQALEQVAGLLPGVLPASETELSGRALAALDAALATPGGRYEGVRNRLRLAKGRLLVHAGRWREADAAVGDLAFQPHLACDDIASVREAMLLDRLIRPNLTGATPAFAALLLERLLFLLARTPGATAQTRLVEAFRHPLTTLLRQRRGIADIAARTGLPAELLASFAGGAEVATALREVAASRTSFDLSRGSLARRNRARPARHVLVTRAMGGAGDITTMIPGAVALARRSGEAVHFAVPRGLMPLIEGFAEIVPLASEDEIAYADYETWFNLGECPAGRIESRSAPRVVKGRIEIFAEAIGVTPDDLDRSGWTARFTLDDAQQALRRRLREAAEARGRPLLGVAPFSRDEYKAAPGLVAALEQLGRDHAILVLHHVQLPLLDAAGARIAETPDLRTLIATIAACDYVITIDTVHVHIAGALGVPTLAIFGPTDGRLATRAYPATALLQPWSRCGVMPCWRHEDSPCHLSLGPASLCLEQLGAGKIVDGFDALARAQSGSHVS